MSVLWAIAFGSGLRDGLNPCIFMSCAVFICHGLWLKNSSVGLGWLRTVFMLMYALAFFEFNFGPAQMLVLHQGFILAAKIIYFILGIGAFVLGVVFFKDWFLSTDRGFNFKAGGYPVVWATAVSAVILSALSTIAPISSYMVFLGYGVLLKGQWQAALPVVASYIFFSMWPLWVIWMFLSLKNLRPSFVKIVCSAVFFTASSCMILILR
jgi:hypothetical protein